MRYFKILTLIFFISLSSNLLSEITTTAETKTFVAASLQDGTFYRTQVYCDINLQALFDETELFSVIRGEYLTGVLKNPDILSLRELWIRRVFSFQNPVLQELSFKIGRIIHTWGNADELKPCDILNPQDLSFLLFQPLQERKIPSLSCLLSLRFFENFLIEGVFLPIFEPSVIDNSVYFPYPVFAEIKKNPFFTIQPAVFPLKRWRDSSWALRLGWSIFKIDGHFNYYNGYDTIPVYEISSLIYIPGPPPVITGTFKPDYKRIVMYGLDFQRALFFNITIRAELAWFDKGKFLYLDQNRFIIDNKSAIEKQYAEYTAGFDVSSFFLRDLYLNFQINQKIISKWSYILKEKEITTSLLLAIEYPLFEQRLKLKTRFFRGIEEEYNAFSFETEFKISGNASLTSGIWIFDGVSDSLFAYYKDRDMLFASVKSIF